MYFKDPQTNETQELLKYWSQRALSNQSRRLRLEYDLQPKAILANVSQWGCSIQNSTAVLVLAVKITE